MKDLIRHIVEDFDFSAVKHNIDQDTLLIKAINDGIFKKLLSNGNTLQALKDDERQYYADNAADGYKYRYVVQDRKELEHILSMNSIGDYNWLDVSKISDMSNLFENNRRFNGDISQWNTLNVTNMHGMFKDCKKFTGDLSHWNTGNVQDMAYMFDGASKFNSPIMYWNTAKVQDMSCMFRECKSFNCKSLYWNTGSVEDMEEMFMNSIFKGDISTWDVSRVKDMHSMFEESKFNGDINNWDVTQVRNMNSMFKNSKFAGTLSNWRTPNLVDMNEMFAESEFNGDVSGFDVSKCMELKNVFFKSKFGNDSISSWDVSHITDMTGLFALSLVKPIWLKPWYIRDGCIITNMFVKDEETYWRNFRYVDAVFNRSKLNESIEAFHGSPSLTIESHTFKRGNHGYLGPGIYFSNSKDEVRKYAKRMGTGMIYTVQLDVDKVLTLTSDDPAKEILNFIYKSDKIYYNRVQRQSNMSYIISSADIKKLTRMGYNAIIWDYAGSQEINVLDKDLIEITNKEYVE